VRKQDIKKVCVDKMFTAVDHQKKTISINDTVNVVDGPFQVKIEVLICQESVVGSMGISVFCFFSFISRKHSF
jgi:hypothetical protein